ncbi:MAG: hypothetical protein RR346_03850 [Bacteroidales bacterium]
MFTTILSYLSSVKSDPLFQSFVDRCCQALFSVLVALAVYTEDVFPLFLLCVGFILLDTASACQMQRRLRRINPNHDKNLGKFRSDKFKDTISTVLYLMLALTLSGAADKLIFHGEENLFPRFITGLFVGWQAWSFLENISSGRDAPWAKLLQRIMVDKAERYTGISFEEFRKLTKKDDSSEPSPY